jgi:hypothetical protein
MFSQMGYSGMDSPFCISKVKLCPINILYSKDTVETSKIAYLHRFGPKNPETLFPAIPIRK